MKIIQILNSVHKNKQSSKYVSLESIVLPPFIKKIDDKIFINALVSIPVLQSLAGKKFKIHWPYEILKWKYPDGDFLECQKIEQKNTIIEFDIAYRVYASKYINLCNSLDSDINNFSTSTFLELTPEVLIKLYLS